ncbi:MAG: ABC transporter permease [Saprospiraceae bacterium]
MFALPISRRYLFGKKSTNAINIISGISVLGIGIGTAALILVMSVLNGFEHLIKGLINSFNPDLKVTLVEGKTFENKSEVYTKLVKLENVLSVIPFLEETALLEYKGVNDFATLKGVDSTYLKYSGLSDKMDEGKFELKNELGNTAVVGIGIRNKLAISVDDPFAYLTAYMPDQAGSTFRPFKKRSLNPVGVFSVQQDYDNKYVYVDLQFMQDLVGKERQITGFEIRLKNYDQKNSTQKEVQNILGGNFKVLDRYQQDASFYKLMKLEKWVSYAILSFVLILVAFNIEGALWMIVLDKKKDILVLKAMGMKTGQVKNIFLSTGMWIVGLGIVMGFCMAIVLYFLQQRFGIVPMSEGFLVDRYPIQLLWSDFFIVAVTVAAIGFIASFFPARKASAINEQIRYE